MDRFKQYIEKLNSYLSMIIVIPALLGGLWQILELSSLSISYIRFFSVSQVVSDGLLILLVMSIFFIASYSINWFMNLSIEDNTLPNDSAKTKYSEFDIKFLFVNLFMIVFSIGITWLMLWEFLPHIFQLKNLLDLVPFIITLIFIIKFVSPPIKYILGMVLERNPKIKKFMFNLVNSIITKNHTVSTSLISSLLGLVFLVLITFSIKYLIFLVSVFRINYILPNDFTNKSNIECFVKKTIPHTKSSKVIYFNDKFFFVEVTYKSNYKQMSVIKFDELFNDNCK